MLTTKKNNLLKTRLLEKKILSICRILFLYKNYHSFLKNRKEKRKYFSLLKSKLKKNNSTEVFTKIAIILLWRKITYKIWEYILFIIVYIFRDASIEQRYTSVIYALGFLRVYYIVIVFSVTSQCFMQFNPYIPPLDILMRAGTAPQLLINKFIPKRIIGLVGDFRATITLMWINRAIKRLERQKKDLAKQIYYSQFR